MISNMGYRGFLFFAIVIWDSISDKAEANTNNYLPM
jgi:hypothetical protein